MKTKMKTKTKLQAKEIN